MPLAGDRADSRKRALVAEQALQLNHILGKALADGGIAPQGPKVFWSVPGARPRPRSIRPRMQRLEGAELLGDHERRVVRQHHPAGAEPDALRVAAMWAIRTEVAEEAIELMLWCSAYQIRR